MKRVALLGAECSGKTTLARALAQRLKGRWVGEVARECLTRADPDFASLCYLARQQLAREDIACAEAVPWLFFDTDLINLRVWFEVAFDRVPEFLQQSPAQRYDGYLLLDSDLPWRADGLRCYADLDSRMRLQHRYARHIADSGLPCVPIAGTGGVRLQRALAALASKRL